MLLSYQKNVIHGHGKTNTTEPQSHTFGNQGSQSLHTTDRMKHFTAWIAFILQTSAY